MHVKTNNNSIIRDTKNQYIIFVLGCNLGHYGTSCSQTCDKCKSNATCNIEFGKCYNLDCSKNVYKPPLCTGKK